MPFSHLALDKDYYHLHIYIKIQAVDFFSILKTLRDFKAYSSQSRNRSMMCPLTSPFLMPEPTLHVEA